MLRSYYKVVFGSVLATVTVQCKNRGKRRSAGRSDAAGNSTTIRHVSRWSRGGIQETTMNKRLANLSIDKKKPWSREPGILFVRPVTWCAPRTCWGNRG